MYLLTAANSFYKIAQSNAIDSSLAKNYNKIKQLSDILAANYVKPNFQGGLIKSLSDSVKELPEDYNWPITSSTSKTEVTNLYNTVKFFYVSLLKAGVKKDELKNSFNNVISSWQNYQTHYLSNTFLNNLYQKDNTKYNFWYQLYKRINDAVISINNLISTS
jgi:hypothetical protein